MEQFTLQLGMMSLQASIVIGVVMLVRLFFMQLRVPKKYMCILWILPYLCMVCPWKVESSFGFWRMPEQMQVEQVQEVLEELPFGNGQVLEEQQLVHAEGDTNIAVNVSAGSQAVPVPNIEESGIESTSVSSAHTVSLILNILFYIWFAGVIGLLAYSIVSYLQLRQKLICSICMSGNIYIADDIHVPFVLGIFKPRIYLPSDLPQENLEYVLAHEKTHIRRWDPLKKIPALCISAVHWFNPLSWVAFHFLEKDMEMACDEETIQTLGWEHKKDYAEALLALSSGKKMFPGAPLAFDEGNVKGRICNILKYKKAWRVATGVAVVLIAVLTVCFMSRRTGENGDESQPQNGTEATARLLSEYLIDLTGDKIDERIVFEVEKDAVGNMSDEEILTQVWAGNISLQVRILEGKQEEAGDSALKISEQAERVLWENTYSGKPEENGNVAVLRYNGRTYLMSYNNDVLNGEGRFWYEVLSFKDGLQSVFAANEAWYDVVNAREIDGQNLTDEQQAVIEQVQLVEEELQKYLRSSWMEQVLLKALKNQEACFLYQGKSKYSGNAYDVFALQAEGTGFELNIEDFFYTKMEGITEMPADARERVLAGEVLTLEVSEENATAGNIDLDGDGQEERIYLEALEGYGKYGIHFKSNTDYRLRVDEAYYQDYGSNIEPRVMLYSPDAETILLAIIDAGPSGDPLTTFFRYDAESGQVLWAGELPWYFENVTIENGVIKSTFRVGMIETQSAIGYWIWNGEKIVRRDDEVYQINLYHERYGENGEIYKDGYMKLKETLTVYEERSEESKAFTMEPQMVLCTSSDLKEWIYLVAEDGTEGWLRVKDFRIPSVGNKESREVFDGLGFAG